MRKIEKDLDKAFSRFIRNRDNNRCVLCGSGFRPECGHFFPRFARSTRWDTQNAFCLCHDCNMRHESDPKPYHDWWIARHGLDAYDALRRKHHTPHHFHVTELEELLSQMKGSST